LRIFALLAGQAALQLLEPVQYNARRSRDRFFCRHCDEEPLTIRSDIIDDGKMV